MTGIRFVATALFLPHRWYRRPRPATGEPADPAIARGPASAAAAAEPPLPAVKPPQRPRGRRALSRPCSASTAIGAPTAASPGGAKVCFALAKPKTSKTEPAGRKRDPAYVFVSTRPAENVKNEVSVIIGYPFKTSSDATAEIGAAKFAMYTQNDGAWIKNVAEEARMIDAMRKGADLTVKGTSGRGTQSTDQYSLKGLAQALDRAEQECK